MKMKLKAFLFAFISLIAVVVLPSSASAGTWGSSLLVDSIPVSGMTASEIHSLAVTHGYPNAGPGFGSCTTGDERPYYVVLRPRPGGVGAPVLQLRVQYCS